MAGAMTVQATSGPWLAALSVARGSIRRLCGHRQLLLVLPVLLMLPSFMATVAEAQPKFPPLTGQIVDDAGLLSAADRSEILDTLRALEAKSTDQVVVYTTKSLQGYPIEDYGYQLGRAWGIGQKDKNNGVILIVAPNERKVRIEVGRGLEPQMTDLMSGLIINNVLLPAFRRGDYAGGIKAAVHDIRDTLLGDAEAVKQRAAGGTKRSPGGDDFANLIPLIFFLIVVAIMIAQVRAQQRQMRNLPPGARRQRRYDNGPIIIPGGWGGSSGGWSGGGGGGWSGGGGDFGGGGASGSW
jgi:uncharacterized protein